MKTPISLLCLLAVLPVASAQITDVSVVSSPGGSSAFTFSSASASPFDNFIVAHRSNRPEQPNGIVYDAIAGARWDAPSVSWQVASMDGNAIPAGAHFNVFQVSSATSARHEAIAGVNIPFANATQLNTFQFGGQPDLKLIVSPTDSLGDGLSQNSPLGVYYEAGNWFIFTEDNAPIPDGMQYTVYYGPDVSSFNTATRGVIGDYTRLPFGGGDAHADFAVTHDWTATSVDVDARVGVRYNRTTRQWELYTEDGSPMPSNADFNVLRGPADPTTTLVGWVYMAWPYVYESETARWFYAAQSGSQLSFHNNLSTGAWSQLNTLSGWNYFASNPDFESTVGDLLFIYVSDTTDWHYYSEFNTQWILDQSTGFWARLIGEVEEDD